MRSRFGLKEVSEGISWAVREIIVQIRCNCKDAEWLKNVDEVAERESLSCGACTNRLKERDYKKTRNGSKNVWLIKKMFELWTMMKPQ